MPTSRRLTGRVLRLGARAAELPVLRAGVRAMGRPQLGLNRLRDARLGGVPPAISPPGPRPRTTATDQPR